MFQYFRVNSKIYLFHRWRNQGSAEVLLCFSVFTLFSLTQIILDKTSKTTFTHSDMGVKNGKLSVLVLCRGGYSVFL